MRRFIVTGTPGSGKTTLIRSLAEAGYSVIEEAATDIIAREHSKGIAEPWADSSFIRMILDLQEQRQTEAMLCAGDIQFADRAPLDTYALCLYLGYRISPSLLADFTRIQAAGGYENTVFFIENLGYCEPTAARKIRYAEALHFEKIHEDVYREWSYHCIKVPPLPVPERVQYLLSRLAG